LFRIISSFLSCVLSPFSDKLRTIRVTRPT
jgi:hypothetical protein